MNKKKIEQFLEKNLKNYKYIYITSDLRGFFFYKIYQSSDEFFDFFMNFFKKKGITVILPSYSYTNTGKFYVDKTMSNLGSFTKWILKKKNISRSNHPIFSTVSFGPNKNITKNIGKSAFGKKSLFYRMNKKKSCLLHLGRPFEMGNTIIHFVEQLVKVDYRFHKIFKTKVYKNKKYISSGYSAFVRKKKIGPTNTIKIANIFRKKKLIKEIGNYKKLTNISIIDFKKCVKIMVQEYINNKEIFLNK